MMPADAQNAVLCYKELNKNCTSHQSYKSSVNRFLDSASGYVGCGCFLHIDDLIN